MPFYEIRCEGATDAVGRELPQWLDALSMQVRNHIALVFTRIQPSNVALCEALCHLGFYPVEMTFHLSMPLRRFTHAHANAPARATLRRATAADLPVVAAIAAEAFWADRFHLDPHLPKQASDRRYEQWVERGFRDGDLLFVYERAGDVDADREIMGFYLIRGAPGEEVDLSLAGVGARYRRAGIGALMYGDMLQLCREMGYRAAATQVSANNLDVMNLFMGLGFTIRTLQLTMHLFLHPGREGAAEQSMASTPVNQGTLAGS
jgi:ribosomal protein S18 acetylase RimI-like enzyme